MTAMVFQNQAPSGGLPRNGKPEGRTALRSTQSPRFSRTGPPSHRDSLFESFQSTSAVTHLPAIDNPSPGSAAGAIGPISVQRKAPSRYGLSRRKVDTSHGDASISAIIQELLSQGTGPLANVFADAEGNFPGAGYSGLGKAGRQTAPAACGAAAKSIYPVEFDDEEEEPYPYPPPPTTAGPFKTPTIASQTKKQNMRLAALLNWLNRNYRMEGREQGGTGSRHTGRDTDLFSFAQDDSHVVFERNLVDIQKLLERAKNVDEKGYNNAALIPDKDKAGKRRKIDKSSPVQHHQLQMFDILSENKTLAGRKPIRVIAADLEKRISTLKTNQIEWEAFQAKIAEYRASESHRARSAPADLIRQNRLMVSHLQERQEQFENEKLSQNQHRLEVWHRKRQQDLALYKSKIAVLRQKRNIVEQAKRRDKDQMGRAEALQRKWFILTVVASRMTIMKLGLETDRQRRAEYLVKVRAARVIQKAYRRFKTAQYEHKKRLALAKIAVSFHKFIRRRREVRKHNASNDIRQFFRDVYDVSRLMKVVKKYRFSVVKAQMYVRSWNAIREAQVDVLCKYWEKLEPHWWSQRKGGRVSSAAELDDKKEKSKGKKGKAKTRKEEIVTEKVPLRVTDATKRSVIVADLIIRRRQHRLQLAQYVKDLSSFNASHKTGKAESGPPRRPIFKLLPAQPDMLSLIEKGFLDAATSGLR
ncbi:hypothetical protein DFS34DRAFT_674109 [Phlyctochytrium arcticum]|nr:hypothetical protein DFS34DRAFT_674109 [Phlyctochytrium arcticum]